jgi:hypothetical protein
MSNPCGQLPSNPAKWVSVVVPWQMVPLPVAMQVSKDGGGGFNGCVTG